jgi:hypothetical protein
MFICNECGHIFSEPEIYKERHPYGEGYASESLACCPCCSGSFSEAVQCAVCGEYFAEEELEDDMCPECYVEGEEDE